MEIYVMFLSYRKTSCWARTGRLPSSIRAAWKSQQRSSLPIRSNMSNWIIVSKVVFPDTTFPELFFWRSLRGSKDSRAGEEESQDYWTREGKQSLEGEDQGAGVKVGLHSLSHNIGLKYCNRARNSYGYGGKGYGSGGYSGGYTGGASGGSSSYQQKQGQKVTAAQKKKRYKLFLSHPLTSEWWGFLTLRGHYATVSRSKCILQWCTMSPFSKRILHITDCTPLKHQDKDIYNWRSFELSS